MINNSDGFDVDSSRNVRISNCRIVGSVGELLHVKTNPRHGGFVENVVIEDVTTGELRSDILGLTTRYFFGAGGEEALDRDYLTPIRGIAIRNVHCRKAPRRLNLCGDYLLPVEDVTVDNVIVDKCAEADFVASVKGLRIDGVHVSPTVAVATAAELGEIDLGMAIWHPEAREYVMAFTDGTVQGSSIRRSRDKKLWSEPIPALCPEDEMKNVAVRSVKIRREDDGWYMDVVFASGSRTYFTPEIFWPFRSKDAWAR